MNQRNNLFKIVTVSVIVLLLLCFTAGCTTTSPADGIKITNSDGTTTVLPGEAQRIALLNSNAGELIYMLGEKDRIVGISQSIANNAEQREMYSNATVIGAWDNPNVESIVSQNVDLIIGYATSKPKNAEVLAASGIPIVYIDCTKPETMAKDLIEVGKIIGKEKEAKEIGTSYEGLMNKIRDAAAPFDFSAKTYAESYTANYGQGANTGMDQLITLTGGTNILSDVNGARKISDEWIVAAKPDIIIKLVNSMDDKENVLKELKNRPGYDQIPAVQNNRVWLIQNDITYGIRSCIGALLILNMEHTDAFGDISVDSIINEVNEKYGTDFSKENLIYPSF